MLTEAQIDIKSHHLELITRCREDVFTHLNNALDLFQLLFPNVLFSITGKEGVKKISVVRAYISRINEIKSWVGNVLDIALEIYDENEDVCPPSSVIMPVELGKKVLRTLLKILSCKRSLKKIDFYFLSDVCKAMNLDIDSAILIIDTVEGEIREAFFDHLLKTLDESGTFHCAVLMYKAILADKRIHLSESCYLDNIKQLLLNDPSSFKAVEKNHSIIRPFRPDGMPDEMAEQLFKYLIEIVLCDKEYHIKESNYIKSVAEVFGYSQTQQIEFIEPIVGRLMAKTVQFTNRSSYCV